MTGPRVAGFLPSAAGSHLVNAFPHISMREIRLEGIAALSIGDGALWLEMSDPTGTATLARPGPGLAVVCFSRTPYSPADPIARRSP